DGTDGGRDPGGAVHVEVGDEDPVGGVQVGDSADGESAHAAGAADDDCGVDGGAAHCSVLISSGTLSSSGTGTAPVVVSGVICAGGAGLSAAVPRASAAAERSLADLPMSA